MISINIVIQMYSFYMECTNNKKGLENKYIIKFKL